MAEEAAVLIDLMQHVSFKPIDFIHIRMWFFTWRTVHRASLSVKPCVRHSGVLLLLQSLVESDLVIGAAREYHAQQRPAPAAAAVGGTLEEVKRLLGELQAARAAATAARGDGQSELAALRESIAALCTRRDSLGSAETLQLEKEAHMETRRWAQAPGWSRDYTALGLSAWPRVHTTWKRTGGTDSNQTMVFEQGN